MCVTTYINSSVHCIALKILTTQDGQDMLYHILFMVIFIDFYPRCFSPSMVSHRWHQSHAVSVVPRMTTRQHLLVGSTFQWAAHIKTPGHIKIPSHQSCETLLKPANIKIGIRDGNLSLHQAGIVIPNIARFSHYLRKWRLYLGKRVNHI